MRGGREGREGVSGGRKGVRERKGGDRRERREGKALTESQQLNSQRRAGGAEGGHHFQHRHKHTRADDGRGDDQLEKQNQNTALVHKHI